MSRTEAPTRPVEAGAPPPAPRATRKARRRAVQRVALYVALIAFAAFTLVPVVWMVLTAFTNARVASGVRALTRWPVFGGRKPRKENASVGRPAPVNAASRADGPGTGKTGN
jgi:hypothetical protein